MGVACCPVPCLYGLQLDGPRALTTEGSWGTVGRKVATEQQHMPVLLFWSLTLDKVHRLQDLAATVPSQAHAVPWGTRAFPTDQQHVLRPATTPLNTANMPTNWQLAMHTSTISSCSGTQADLHTRPAPSPMVTHMHSHPSAHQWHRTACNVSACLLQLL